MNKKDEEDTDSVDEALALVNPYESSTDSEEEVIAHNERLRDCKGSRKVAV